MTTTLCEPEVARMPVQEPDATHDVALVEDQVRVVDPLVGTFVAELEIVTVGGGTVEDPPPPPQPLKAKTVTNVGIGLRKSLSTESILKVFGFFAP